MMKNTYWDVHPMPVHFGVLTDLSSLTWPIDAYKETRLGCRAFGAVELWLDGDPTKNMPPVTNLSSSLGFLL